MLGRLNQLKAGDRDRLMAAMLRQLPALIAEDKGIVDHLRVTPFVPTTSGSLQAPQALHDPR